MTATEQAPLIDELVRMMADARRTLLAKLDEAGMSDEDKATLIGAMTHYDKTGIAVTVFLPGRIAQQAAGGKPVDRAALVQALAGGGTGMRSEPPPLTRPTA